MCVRAGACMHRRVCEPLANMIDPNPIERASGEDAGETRGDRVGFLSPCCWGQFKGDRAEASLAASHGRPSARNLQLSASQSTRINNNIDDKIHPAQTAQATAQSSLNVAHSSASAARLTVVASRRHDEPEDGPKSQVAPPSFSHHQHRKKSSWASVALASETPRPDHPLSMMNRLNKQRHQQRCGSRRMWKPIEGFSVGGLSQMILLVLFLLLLLPNCLVSLLKLPNIRPASGAHSEPAGLYHADDGESPMMMSAAQSGDDDYATRSSSSDPSDNLTQIPFEYGKLPTTAAATTAASTSTTPRPAALRRAPVLRVTESELLPFTDFNVQQPTFSDLMKSWPPTTQQAAQLASAAAESFAARYAGSGRQNQGGQRPGGQQQQQQRQHDFLSASSAAAAEEAQLMRNHLNEDLDDTIVTADQGFERDQVPEPPTLINYLGDLGDYIYVQLKQYFDSSGNIAQQQQQKATSYDQGEQPAASSGTDNNESQPQQQQPSSGSRQLKVEAIDELLDDHYYDQYENSQVLYYGPQLVREGDIFEIGCYLPHDHRAEWTKSGRALVAERATGGSPRVIRQSDFLGAKQNFSLKIFEASLSDSGNYRCDRMSRKYHKLVVVPQKTTTAQLFVIQQRLLSVVNPRLVSVPQLAAPGLNVGPHASPSALAAANQQVQRYYGPSPQPGTSPRSKQQQQRNYLLPGYLIVEGQPLVVSCNISDEFVLRRLRENPQFQLAWYKNGKQLRGSFWVSPLVPAHPSAGPAPAGGGSPYQSGHSGPPAAIQVQVSTRQQAGLSPQQQQLQTVVRGRQPSAATGGAQTPAAGYPRSNQRIQFLQANGRQLYITSALYSDAGDYLCSWSKLPARQQPQSDPADENSGAGEGPSGQEAGARPVQQQPFAGNPLAAGSLLQLMAPVKLRPFKSTYHARAGDELRLVCKVQRGFPSAHISWYVGNRLVDAEFLREHANEFRVLQLQNQNQVIVASGGSGSSANAQQEQPAAGAEEQEADRRHIVEINPVPSSRQQMTLTANGRGQWVEYRDPKSERYAIGTPEQQLRYLQQKLAQLAGLGAQSGNQLPAGGGGGPEPAASSLLSQTSISVLVINQLQADRHSARYACRATTRTNTDEVTTVIRVQDSSIVVHRPSSGRATLVPGQPLHFQCLKIGNIDAGFLWYKRPINEEREELLSPNNDDTITIHNDRLTLMKPTVNMAGDYVCRSLLDGGQPDNREAGVIQVRTQPYIEDFGQETSHTGKSSTVIDGERLELTCTVHDKITPVNITWLRSMTPDDESTMVPIAETPRQQLISRPVDEEFMQTLIAEQNIVIESLSRHSKRLVIESVKPEHRSYYVCMADNGVTERTRKIIFIRVKDRLVALWPFLGIVAELFILFTIIHIWETQRAYKEIQASNARETLESVPLTSGQQ